MVTAILFISMTNSYGQFYFNLGFGIGTNKDLMNTISAVGPISYHTYNGTYTDVFTSVTTNTNGNSSTTNTDNPSTTITQVRGGFGNGVNIGGTFGYKLNEHLSAELGIFYIPGATINTEHQDSYLDSYTYNYSFESFYTNINQYYDYKFSLTTSGRVRLMPTLKLNADQKVFTPYLKVGLVIGLGGSITFTEIETYNVDTTSSYVTGGITTINPPTSGAANYSYGVTLSGGMSLGFTAAIGSEYKLTDKISLFGEFSLISEQWSPTSGTVTKYVENGIDELASLTPSQKQFTFTNNVSTSSSTTTTTTNINTSNSAPIFFSQYPKQSYSFSSWGVNIGIKINL